MHLLPDPAALTADLDARGWAILPGLLNPTTCAAIAAGYDDPARFRSQVVMARHGFGRGEYRYYRYPLPDPIAGLRTALYPSLVGVANRWHERLGIPTRFPGHHAEFLARCHDAGQARPTPLLLRYGPGDYNCLHQVCMATMFSRFRSRCCCRGRVRISPVANSS